MIFVNAEGLVMGRVASFCAKKALQKEEIVVVNAEKALITGRKEILLDKYSTKFHLLVKGNPTKGPNASRMPDKIFRDAISGMTPHKKATGREAIKRVMVYIGMPEKFKGKEFVDLSKFKCNEQARFMQLGELTKLLGARW